MIIYVRLQVFYDFTQNPFPINKYSLRLKYLNPYEDDKNRVFGGTYPHIVTVIYRR